MARTLALLALCICLSGGAWAQQDSKAGNGPGENQAPPRSDRNQSDRNREAGESSSRDTRIDLSPPKDDEKNHPYSKSAVADAEGDRATEGATRKRRVREEPGEAVNQITVPNLAIEWFCSGKMDRLGRL